MLSMMHGRKFSGDFLMALGIPEQWLRRVAAILVALTLSATVWLAVGTVEVCRYTSSRAL